MSIAVAKRKSKKPETNGHPESNGHSPKLKLIEEAHIHEQHEGATFYPLLSIELLMPSPTNPRKHFDQAELEELAESFRDVGMIQPILARPVKPRKGDRVEVSHRAEQQRA